ncbi:hemerythrin domain-containing protein [Kitasatospora sp. CM 4170]|uniref:Hemerythrin domain-containing protein n=1 Tax=Kitasatospora aburaviensis TaxID=67265 RepID=A0ABW1F085_9ACTN|nr:hemerythrin domain-containing protein [Kitasatospora sp. CM 4170]WNM43547.1 hemerythrin domain-containing protein [Kitasatospora sp. CM 4170]
MSNDAIVLLREDHKEVRRLFREYRGLADGDGRGDDQGHEYGHDQGHDQARREAVERIVEALTIHTYLEEELVYPRIRREVPDLAEEMDRAKEEHHVADVLCEELSRMTPEDEGYDAKTAVLIEAVERHIDEEEDAWFPRIRAALGRKELQEIGERMKAVRETAPRHPTGSGMLHRIANALEG